MSLEMGDNYFFSLETPKESNQHSMFFKALKIGGVWWMVSGEYDLCKNLPLGSTVAKC